jgi:hypothetical protein
VNDDTDGKPLPIPIFFLHTYDFLLSLSLSLSTMFAYDFLVKINLISNGKDMAKRRHVNKSFVASVIDFFSSDRAHFKGSCVLDVDLD